MGHNSLLFLIISVAKIFLQAFLFDSKKPGVVTKMTTKNNFLFLFVFMLQKPLFPSRPWQVVVSQTDMKKIEKGWEKEKPLRLVSEELFSLRQKS